MPLLMPGAGGTGQQPQQQQGVDLYDLLATEIAKTMQQPQPQAPMPAQQQPLSPTSAFAAARNPQFAPHLINQAQAPEQARFAQQQAAFEQAMSGRQNAMSAGVSMVNSQNRAYGQGGRPALAILEMDDPDNPGKKVRNTVNVIRDLDGTARIQVLGATPWTPGNVPAVPGASPQMTFPRGSSTPGAATPVPGAPVPPAPPSVEEDYRKNQAFIDGSNHLREAFRELKGSTAGRSGLGNVIGQELGEFKYGGAIPYSAPNAKFESELRTTLDTMIVAITGLSFPENAFRRYRSELPVATDSEDQAMQKIDNVVRKFIAEQKSMKQTYPAVGGGAASAEPTESIVDKALRLAEERRRGGQRFSTTNNPPETSGALQRGNINVQDRPIVSGPGGQSTVRSMSFERGGREILIPTVSEDGRLLSNEEAIREFDRTGRHLGIFRSASEATEYAKRLHEWYEQQGGQSANP